MARLVIGNVVWRIVYNFPVANYSVVYLLVNVISRITLKSILLDRVKLNFPRSVGLGSVGPIIVANKHFIILLKLQNSYYSYSRCSFRFEILSPLSIWCSILLVKVINQISCFRLRLFYRSGLVICVPTVINACEGFLNLLIIIPKIVRNNNFTEQWTTLLKRQISVISRKIRTANSISTCPAVKKVNWFSKTSATATPSGK